MSQKILFLLFAIYCSSGMTWKQIFTLSGVAISGFLYLIYSQQEKILYLNETIPPKRTSENPSPFANPKQHEMDYKDVWITTTDNVKLHGWWIPYKGSKTPVPTLVFYHANAGNMGFRLPNLAVIHKELKVNIFIISYRGYGESEGIPNEEGIKIDALAAFDWVYYNKLDNIDLDRIYIFGRSLGGAVAINTTAEIEKNSAYEHKIAGLIIENTFSSISDMVGKVFPFLDFEFIKQFMLKIKWKSIEKMPNIRTKILFLACNNDEIVPHEQMLRLYEAASNCKHKDMFVIEGGMHNDGWMKGGNEYWDRMNRFVHSN